MGKKKELDQSEKAIGLGVLHGRDSLFVRVAVGTVARGGLKYELSQSMNGAPMIRSEQSGRTFVFDWQRLIEYAVEEIGIDNAD